MDWQIHAFLIANCIKQLGVEVVVLHARTTLMVATVNVARFIITDVKRMRPVSRAIVIQLDRDVHSVILMDNVHVTPGFMARNVINADQDILDSQKQDAGIA